MWEGDPRGFLLPLVAPFTSDGMLDRESLKRQVRHYREKGVEQFVWAGTVSEGPYLSWEEALVGIGGIYEAASRATLFVGSMEKTRQEIVDFLTLLDEFSLACGLLVAPSILWPPGDLERVMAKIVNSKRQVILYNPPDGAVVGREIVRFSRSQIESFAANENVIGLKDGDAETLLWAHDFRLPINLYCGSDFQIGYALSFCQGCVAASGHFFTEELVEIGRSFQSDEIQREEGQAVFSRISSGIQRCFEGLKPAEVIQLIKLHLVKQGVISKPFSRAYNLFSGGQNDYSDLLPRLENIKETQTTIS